MRKRPKRNPTPREARGRRRRPDQVGVNAARRGYAEKWMAERKRENTGRGGPGTGGKFDGRGAGALSVGRVENSRPMLVRIKKSVK